MTGMWSQLQRCDNLRRSFTQSVKHVPDSSCDDCMDGADCMTRKARGLCLDCMDGADCRKAPGCPGEHDGSHLASKQATFKHDKSLTAFQTTYYIHRRAEPNCNNKHRKLCACPTKVHVTLKASDRRDDGCIANYSPLLSTALSCSN